MRLVASGVAASTVPRMGTGSRLCVPSMLGTGSRSREVRRGAAATRNVPAVSHGTCARSRRRGQRVEGRAAHAAIRRRARWGRLVTEANTRPDHRCRDFTKTGRLAGRICSLLAAWRRRTAEAAVRAPSAPPATKGEPRRSLATATVTVRGKRLEEARSERVDPNRARFCLGTTGLVGRVAEPCLPRKRGAWAEWPRCPCWHGSASTR